MEWSNETVLEFLTLYEQEHSIWWPKHPEHKNRNAINDAWKRIEEKMSINCSVIELKKKKESLMAMFRPLVKKVKATSEMGTDEVYKPTWFAFEKMASFLHGNYKPKNMNNTEDLEFIEELQDMEANFVKTELFDYEIEHDEGCSSTEIEAPRETSNTSAIYEKHFKAPENKKRKRCFDPAEERVEESYKIKSVENSKTTQCSLYGQLIAQKLETFDEVTRVVIMHDIDDIFFRAKMSQVNRKPNAASNSTNNLQQFPSFMHQILSYCPHISSPLKQQATSSPTSQSTSSGFPSPSYQSQPSPEQTFMTQATLERAPQVSAFGPTFQSSHSQSLPSQTYHS